MRVELWKAELEVEEVELDRLDVSYCPLIICDNRDGTLVVYIRVGLTPCYVQAPSIYNLHAIQIM